MIKVTVDNYKTTLPLSCVCTLEQAAKIAYEVERRYMATIGEERSEYNIELHGREYIGLAIGYLFYGAINEKSLHCFSQTLSNRRSTIDYHDLDNPSKVKLALHIGVFDATMGMFIGEDGNVKKGVFW